MVKVIVGDLFESQAQTLVNTVNTVGVMGKGIALEFKKRFPQMYVDYVNRCRTGQVKMGEPYLYRSLVTPWVLNFPTKDHWRSIAKLEDIAKGLCYLERRYQEWGITSLAVPPLGCGEGELEWRIVGPTLYRHLQKLHITVELYAPYGTPHEELRPTFLVRTTEKVAGGGDQGIRVKPAWVALVEILDEIVREPYHYPIGRTSFQKIAYFATEAGIPTGLSYQRGAYGPYTPELKRLLTRLTNNGLIREERRGRMFVLKSGPTFADARTAYEPELAEWRGAIERIGDLFMRMRTGQAELAATVLFAAKEAASKLGAEPSERNVLDEVLCWKQRRRPPVQVEDIGTAIRVLGGLRWLQVTPSHDLPVHEEATFGG